MAHRPRLITSIPFWVLIVGSLVTAGYGAWLFLGTSASIAAGLTAQTATTADVYVGQIVAIVGGILIATGLIGLALALTIAVARSFVPAPAAEVLEPIDWTEESDVAGVEALEGPDVEVPTTDEAPVAAPAHEEPVIDAGPEAPVAPEKDAKA